MDFVFVTGKLGQGKTLVAVSKIKERFERGCRVATNCDIFLQHMFHRNARNIDLVRIPDKPSLEDLEAIGTGYDSKQSYDESKNGLLVLDECGTWFNSRNWQDKSRSGVNNWFLHARKLGWDVYLIVQDVSIVDSQARDALTAAIARCKRLDKISIPFITQPIKAFTGLQLRPPRVHSARVEDADGIFLDRWAYRGSDLFFAYDTRQHFRPDYPHGVHSVLTPWHIYGRYSKPLDWSRFMRLTKIYLKRYSQTALVVAGLVFGSVATLAYDHHQQRQHSTTSAKTPAISAPTGQASPGEAPKSFAAGFQGWHFDGSMLVNGLKTFFVITDKGARIRSSDEMFEGVTLSEPNDCVLKLSKGIEHVFLTCTKQIDPLSASRSVSEMASAAP